MRPRFTPMPLFILLILAMTLMFTQMSVFSASEVPPEKHTLTDEEENALIEKYGLEKPTPKGPVQETMQAIKNGSIGFSFLNVIVGLGFFRLSVYTMGLIFLMVIIIKLVRKR